jgi:hypothetical protein
MFATRRLASVNPRVFGAARGFQSTARASVQVGDAIPNIDLVETSPGNKVNIAKELQGKGVIIGVPAAFSTLPNPSLRSRAVLCCPAVPEADKQSSDPQARRAPAPTCPATSTTPR